MRKFFTRNIIIKIVIIVIGAISGYLYYFYIGCSGSCPISSNQYFSTLYGALVGYLFSEAITEKKNEIKNSNS